MASLRLHNYLRAHRRKSGLTQQEIAFLLGCRNGELVSRYEKRRRLPPLETALACEAIFDVPVSGLFAGVRDARTREIRKRMVELRSKLQAKTTRGSDALLNTHKLKWLEAHGILQETEITVS